MGCVGGNTKRFQKVVLNRSRKYFLDLKCANILSVFTYSQGVPESPKTTLLEAIWTL